MTAPKCRECAWFRETNHKYNLCDHPKRRYQIAKNERSVLGECGSVACNFEPKKVQKTP